jgi:hypothetical protein
VIDGHLFRNAEAIQVQDAPGIGLTFESPGDVVFDMSKHCETYGVAQNRGLQIRTRQMGDSISAGESLPSLCLPLYSFPVTRNADRLPITASVEGMSENT